MEGLPPSIPCRYCGPMGDAALVDRALADSRVGFAEIYDTYGDRLYDYCYGILRSTADANDALQDTFLAALDKLPQLRDPEKLRPWLYAIARSQCFRRTRARKREQVSDTIAETAVGEADVTSSIESEHLPALVWDAVAGLSDVDRAVIDLNVRHQLEGEDLASSLGVPASKSYVMLHRAKSRLETSIGALLVARAGTDDCAELDEIVSGQDFTPLIRKRVARHTESCVVCRETRERNRPEKLLALVPFIGAPAGLREQILSALDVAAQTSVDGTDSDGATFRHDDDLRVRSQKSERLSSAADALEWDGAGFPTPIPATRVPAWIPLAVSGAIAAALLLILGFVVLDRSGDAVVEVAGVVRTTTEGEPDELPGPTLSDSPPSTQLGPTSSTPQEQAPPTTEPVTAQPPSTAAPTQPPPTDTEPPPPPSETTTTTEPPDATPPEVAPVTAECGAEVTLSLLITDDRGLGPVDVRASWPDDQGFFTDSGGGVYTMRIRSVQLPPNRFTIMITGTAADLAGNVATISDTADCTPPDVTPPRVSRLTVQCGGLIRLSVDIVDDRTEKLTVSATASWQGGSADFSRLGGSTYGVEIPSNVVGDGEVRFTVSGTAADLAGNTTRVDRSGSCTIIN